jgi:hypothetical protein
MLATAPLALAALTLLALLAPAGVLASASKARAIRIEVPTPAQGDVTIEQITTTIPSRVAEFPELELFAPNDRALAPSVLALTATRTERGKRSTTFRTVVLVLDRRAAGAAARAAGNDNDALGEYTAKLILGEELEDIRPQDRAYIGLSFAFTDTVPASTDVWSQERQHRQGGLFDVGVQPNANAGATDVRACWALTGTIELGPTGKPAPGLTYGFFDGPGALPWSHNGIGSTFVHFAAGCHPGAGGLNGVFTPVEHDLGFSDGELGPETGSGPLVPLGPPAPISKEQAEAIVFGAELLDEPELAEAAEEDYVLWQELEEFFSGPATDSDSLLAPAPGRRAHAASIRSGAVPADGQVTKVEVRGYYLGGCPVAEEVCERNIHFQDLRPLPGGGLEVLSTTQAFTLPKQPGTYSFAPTNFFVQKGDYIGLATVGGKFKLLVKAPGAATDVFVKDKGDMNGAHVTGSRKAGEELNMRVTLQPSG